MATPLLTTKLYVPPVRPGLVSRPRLIERLNAGLDRKLTLISAPAGFGKSTLLSEWVAGIKWPVAWISLDKGDNDPARFLAYLVVSLQTIEPDVGKSALAALQSPQPPPMEAVLTGLINEIATVPDHFVLVLDDYHLIEAQPIHDALTFLLDHLPPQMHLVIASRADLPLHVARLRGRGAMIEIRSDDLRFAPDEAAAFLNEVMGLDLSHEDVEALEARTEGWITGLQMAALSMQGRKDIRSFIAAFTGSHRYVLDYLIEEVFQGQPPDVQDFLLQTSILDRFTARVCDAITERDDSQEVLLALEQANLFIISLDDSRQWYCYHRLFADLLRHRFQTVRGEDVVTQLHKRACRWYEAHGLSGEAVSHAFAAEDFEGAARLIELTGLEMLSRGELVTLLGWVDGLSERVVRTRPWLCTIHAWALTLTGQLDAVEPRLQDAERRLTAGDEEYILSRPEGTITLNMVGHIAAIRAYVAALEGEMQRAVELSRQALERLSDDDLVVRSVVVFTLGVASLASDDIVGASRAFAEASAIGQAAGNIHLAVPAMCSLANLQARQGRLHQAAETYQDALQLAETEGRPLQVAAMAHIGIGNLLCEWDDLEGARGHVMAGLEQGQQWGNPDGLANGYVALAQVLQVRGDLDGAVDAVQKAERVVEGHTVTPMTAAQVAAARPRQWLAQGDLEAAARWARESQLGAEHRLSFLSEAEDIMVARVLIGQGKLGEAVGLLARLQQAAKAAGRMRSVLETLVLQAVALAVQGGMSQAMHASEQALSLAEPEGYVRIFVDEGEPMAKLLQQAAAQGIAPDYVGTLLAAFRGEAKKEHPLKDEVPPPSAPRPSPMVEPLTPRELEVLRLIAAGLRNQEIADQLVISVATVKRHISNIYGKLGVSHRTQAIARAKELNLL